MAGFAGIHTTVSGNARDTVTVSISIANSDAFVAFDVRIKLHAQLTYLPSSAALTGREVDHSLSAGIVGGDTLRILAYSTNGTAFTGNSGSVASFRLKLGTVPGNYSLNPSKAVIGNSSAVNILTGTSSGQVTLLAPDISLNTTSLSYTRTVVGTTRDMSFTISNVGNSTLTIDSLVASPISAYSVVPGWSGTVAASGSQGISVRFAPPARGAYSGTVKVYTRDPDESMLQVTLSGTGYTINELHVNNLSTRSGEDTVLTFRINNQEAFTGFQFDLTLPSPLTYTADSEELTGRASDHSVSANTIAGGKLRVVAYSSTQSAFSGSDGDVVKVGFHVDGIGGSYSLSLSNVIITNSSEENIVSDSYNGTLTLAAGDIQSNTSINYGSVSIFDTATVNLTVQNVGNDTLRITSFTPNAASFWKDASFPLTINASQQTVVPTHFHSGTPGSYSGKFRVRSNDPDEDPYDITLLGTAYSPNTMEAQNASCVDGGYVDLYVDIENNDDFTAFQLDLSIPSPLTVILDLCKLTSRSQGHMLGKAHVSGNTYRFLAYSSSSELFTGSSGAVLRVGCSVSGDAGTYAIIIEDPVISDASSQNILSGSSNGTLTLNGAALAKAKVFLEGPYQSGSSMTTSLKAGGYIPTTSPYSDSRFVDPIPADIVDWVFVELRSTPTGSAVSSRSFFLKSNGSIVDEDGTTTDLEMLGVSDGNYYIVVKHRNHLAVMSASAQSLNSTSATLYDFTTGTDKYYGSDAKLLETGVYGMYAGDTNGSGIITNADRESIYANLNSSGYSVADVNCSGIITNADRESIYSNINKASQVQ